jgi:Fic-DOC domain mobile mystery protein B
MTDLFQEPDDATPLQPEEREGLLQSWITHRKDLNEAEQENIVAGAAWARGRRRQPLERMLSVDFIQRLHERMFGDVWRWAGAFRTTERNIGIQAYRIPTELAALLDDVRYWVANETYQRDVSGDTTN